MPAGPLLAGAVAIGFLGLIVEEHVRGRVGQVHAAVGERPLDGDERLTAHVEHVVLAGFVNDSAIARPLGDLRFGVAARRGHPALDRPLTLARWLAHAPTWSCGSATSARTSSATSSRGVGWSAE
ncbi:hypothetical protein [Sorangium sp. So ce693]|uniref:hypothetical protein n=1 Tax=Sorangium sp. So ce693 TaxID=3133318 RepID=UPI003F5DAA7F